MPRTVESGQSESISSTLEDYLLDVSTPHMAYFAVHAVVLSIRGVLFEGEIERRVDIKRYLLRQLFGDIRDSFDLRGH